MIKILVSGCAHYLFPVELHEGFFGLSDKSLLHIPRKYPFQMEWGCCMSNSLPIEEYTGMPLTFCATWLSIIECKFYITSLILPVRQMEIVWNQKHKDGNWLFSHILLGMAPYGTYVLWFYGNMKSVIVAIDKAEETTVCMKDFLPQYPNISIEEYCNDMISKLQKGKEKVQRGLPFRDLFDNYMKQFIYRYLVLLEKCTGEREGIKWEKYKENEDKVPEFEYMEEFLLDGTHDKLHDGGLQKYHHAGKPKKLAVKWHIGKSEYFAYFWFEEEPIREVFDKFYGAHPDTKTDFIIRIDAENKKYELALYRYGLKEPQVIPENVYQLLVFKNKFEDYRSDNYNQERGAWIW